MLIMCCNCLFDEPWLLSDQPGTHYISNAIIQCLFATQEVLPANEVFLISDKKIICKGNFKMEDAKSRIFQDEIGQKLNQIANIPAYVNDVLFGKMIFLP